MEEGDIASFFVKDLRLALFSAENVPRPIRGLQRSIAVRRFRRRKTFFFPIFFLDEPLPGAPRHTNTKFRANIRGTDFAGPIVSNI